MKRRKEEWRLNQQNAQLDEDDLLLSDLWRRRNSNNNRFETLPMQRVIACICAVLTHTCLGGIYTFSLFTDALSKNVGVINRTPQDWDPAELVPIFSVTYGVSGLTALSTGEWAERMGPRVPIALAGVFWGGGLVLTSLALRLHSLGLLYISYGVFAGIGNGLACTYTFLYGPVLLTQTLCRCSTCGRAHQVVSYQSRLCSGVCNYGLWMWSSSGQSAYPIDDGVQLSASRQSRDPQ